jgi:YidC/Oxa1 family membrane protein insertase
MSQKPAPRGNFMQTLLIVMTLWLGYSLITGGMNKPTDTRTPEQFMSALRTQTAEIEKLARETHKPIARVIADFEAAGRPLEVRAQVPSLSDEQVLEQLRIAHRLLLDQSAGQLLGYYQSKVSALEKSGKITAADAQRRRLQATILVADTQFQAGKQRRDRHRIYNAYLTLHAEHRALHTDPMWQEQVDLPPTLSTPATRVTAEQLFQEIVSDLSARNRAEMVWGFFPGYGMIDFLVKLTGAIPGFSYAFAALLLAICVRAVVWPLYQRQLMFSRQMMQLQPLVKELRDRYTGQELNMKVMELYREYGINPAAGCLPAMLQVPLFLLVYQCMVMYQFQFTKGTFLWINPTMSASSNGFIAPNLGERDYVMLIIYGISMVVTTLLTPISDPANARQQRLIGLATALFFTVLMFFWPLPSAFVLYWLFTNILTMFQSIRGYRMPVPPLVKVNAPGGGVFPSSPLGDRNGHADGNGHKGLFQSTGQPKTQKPRPKKRK